MTTLSIPIEPVFFLPFISILGLIFGSFITALSYRLPRGLSVARGRSRCFSCGNTLTARDLVPVFSWLAARGACRYCGTRVSARYPAIEVATATLFLASAVMIDDGARLAVALFITVISMTLAVVDVEHRRLPNAMVLALAGGALLWRLLGDADLATAGLSAAVTLIVGLGLAAILKRLSSDSIGMGDIKLMGAMALAFPPTMFLAMLVGAGLLALAIGIAIKKVRSGPARLPLGAVLLTAFWVGLVAG